MFSWRWPTDSKQKTTALISMRASFAGNEHIKLSRCFQRICRLPQLTQAGKTQSKKNQKSKKWGSPAHKKTKKVWLWKKKNLINQYVEFKTLLWEVIIISTKKERYRSKKKERNIEANRRYAKVKQAQSWIVPIASQLLLIGYTYVNFPYALMIYIITWKITAP